MQNNRPTANVTAINSLKNKAEQKITRFQKKISNIETKLRDINDELNTVTAIVEYEDRHQRRNEILNDLFVYQGEYGTHEKATPEITEYFEKRKLYLESQVKFYETQKSKRLDGIKFMESDITLLERIAKHWSRSIYSDNAIIDC